MAPYDSARIARTLTTVVFTPTRLREGYDIDEVDRFIDQVIVMVKAGEPREDIERFIDATAIEKTRVRTGYDIHEVDEFFTKIRAALAVPFDPKTPRSVASSPKETTRLVTMIENVRFQQTKYSSGYDQDDVDDFLDSLIAAVKRGKRGSDIETFIAGAKFNLAKFREGYDMDEVDEFLDRFILASGGDRATQPPHQPEHSVLRKLFGRE